MEKLVRDAFIAKGGKPQRKSPIYMTLGENHHMNTWYTQPEVIKINVNTLDLNTVSFTYGDMFPVFNPKLDMGEEYRNTIYSYDEILKIIDKYGYPEDIAYSVINSVYPMERPINHYLKYIEAQVLSNDFIADLKI